MDAAGRPSQGDLVARLRAAGCVYAEEEAAVLLEAADEGGDLEALVGRRVAGDPLEHVVGWAEFCGLRVGVSDGVFVPRRRTEELVDRAVLLAPRAGVVVDLCCGTGALGLAFAARVEIDELHAVDVEPRAVACARRNFEAWSRPAGSVHEGDLFEALPDDLRGRVDVLLANTPYVPTEEIALLPGEARDHEPTVTLDGGEDGLDVARRVVDGAREWLAPGGWVFIEASDRQSSTLREHMERRGLTASIRDSVVAGNRRPAGPL
ncbi:putative protein N(5)-glutamine methyltransferase [Nocardioides sp. JQ2195]|uniref:putative protein N(5)-glutamine methyltransferase n=1 Tax=Nocardioides sp. JQ2195 TaxID=2592334 RepID=UPI00143EAD1F|nr:putative protein N(5)-glutamine methyltransferase [Nocardioides sp. JQ2195]QIX28389.1 putative protein N(5)-glutamine methyltransferase [Nocardioides sp. JQ2195]